jgi:very-short-patch-repair endonuclease
MRGKQDHSRERNLRRAQTDAEARLWHYLRDRRLERYKFRRQHKIGTYFVDLVCAEAGLIVELDGGQHAERESYDATRTAALEAAGYRVIRFWNNDVLERTDAVLTEILRALNERNLAVLDSPLTPALSPLAGRGSKANIPPLVTGFV